MGRTTSAQFSSQDPQRQPGFSCPEGWFVASRREWCSLDNAGAFGNPLNDDYSGANLGRHS